MRTLERLEAFIARWERRAQRRKRKAAIAQQRDEISALTKLNRALGERLVYVDLHDRERIIGWNPPKRERPRCGATTRAGGSCKAPALPERSAAACMAGFHWPKTLEGKARSLPASRHTGSAGELRGKPRRNSPREKPGHHIDYLVLWGRRKAVKGQ